MKATEETIKNLEILFEFAPPQKLKANVTFLLHKFLMLNPDGIPVENGQELYQNIIFFLEFLDKASEEQPA